ncbi:GNAT family N-acetyltransferase [Micromonospora sp. NPDC049497]|uniref:GNAT family N-acetyltransferase n=1 Tax=Micromonospora sp. NPDC049497 TaxID=3364273 RepID=UPI0037A510BE
MTIRERLPDDLDGCVTLLRAVHEADRYPLNWPDDPRRWLTPDGIRAAWVAEGPHARIVGHVLVVGGVAGAEVAVSRLFVVSEFRRQAIGRRLIDRAREWARSHRLPIVLEVVERIDGAAPALYEAAGWQLVR